VATILTTVLTVVLAMVRAKEKDTYQINNKTLTLFDTTMQTSVLATAWAVVMTTVLTMILV